ATPAVQSGADGQWEISGKTGNGTTLYTVQVSDGDVINLRDLPAGTGYRIAFENVDERVMTGFTWNRQSYITASMEGTIGNTLPEYEALVIYPDGIYVPHTELVCLSETVPDPLPDFALIPANERTEKAVSEGWIEIPEGMQGKAELSEDGTGTVCFSDESGQECGIRVHCMGEYQFRIVPLQDERSRFSVQKDSGLLRLRADCNGSDVLRFTDECPKIAIYGMETLDLSVEGLVTEEEFRLVASFVHERVQLDDETVRLTRNGAEETLTLEEGTALLNVKSGDRLSLLLPSGTAYFLEPVTDEAGSLELTGTDAATGQLNGPTACRLIVCRKEASLDLTVRRITEAADNGEIRFSFFEGDAEEETGTVSDIRVLRNGTPVSLTDGTVSVSDGDVLSVSGRLAGMRCRVTALDADSLITQMSTDGAAFRECSEIWMTFRSDTPERVSVVQTEAAVEIPGILELSGGALKKDMFEVVIEGADQEQETIRCPEAEDGRSTFKSRKRFLTSLGTVQWKVTSGYLGQNPTVVGDASAFIVRISAEQGEAGTVIMSRRIFLQLPDGGETKTEAIRFTGICLFPVRVSVESADSEKILPCRIVVTEAGAIDRFSYTAGTRSGTIRSGESLLLCNEEATIWLPYKAQYQVCPQLPSGYVLENEEETILTGCVGPDSAGIRLLCRYKPAVQLEGQSGYRIPVQVKFQGEEWTEEQFGFTLVPAEDETNSAGDRGFRFSDGSEALHYVADAEQPEFDVTVVADGTGEEKGIQVLRGGEYRFYLKQTDMTDEGIRYDESVAELILEVTDDGEGHLVPSFRPAENELPVFINTAQTTLYVTCEVNCQEGQSYGIEDAQRKKLPVHVRIDGLSASTVSVLSVKRGADEQIPVREESIELLLSHGETVCLTGLPTGGTYSVETGNDLSGYRAQTEAKTGNLDYHSENRVVFPFTYAPSGSVTVKGKISLLYRKAQTGEKARFVMIPADDFTRDRFEVGYRLETEVSLGKLQAGRIREQMAKNTFSVSMAAPATFFSFDPLVFSEPGIYTFELSQISGNMVDTVYDDSVYLVRITVTDPEPGSGVLQAEYVILKGGAETELSFANAYAASGEAEIKGTFSLEGRRASADEFSFLLLDEEGNQIAGCRNQADGKIAFPALMYDASDIGTVRYYRIRQSPGELGGITYDEREFRAIVAIRDEGDGVLSTSVAYLTKTGEGQWTPSDEVHFANQYKAEGALTISGEVRMLGRPFLLGESFEVQLTQEMDEDEWAEMETIVLNPEDGNRIPFSFDEIEYRLDDAEAGPLRYKVSLTANGENVRVEGDEERIFRIDITDNGDGTLNLSSSLDGELSFALMGLTEKTLCCEFDDDNNASGLRPESLTVRLLANGQEAEKIRLSEENGWQTSTGALPMADEKENDIRYELEPERARLYGLTLSWEDPDTASLVARYRPHFGSNDNLLVRLLAPATGDSGSVIGYFLALAVSGIVVAVIIRRGKKD
ncbi:MAG: Cna B-type domain-containing protein, partial [Clostridia bacterium]|nr:Cna B-type domain-containing protein [Clostridia bacterium]